MKWIKLTLIILLVIVSVVIAFVNYSKAQSTPTRTWIPEPGICEPPATNCFNDVIIEPPQ